MPFPIVVFRFNIIYWFVGVSWPTCVNSVFLLSRQTIMGACVTWSRLCFDKKVSNLCLFSGSQYKTHMIVTT